MLTGCLAKKEKNGLHREWVEQHDSKQMRKNRTTMS